MRLLNETLHHVDIKKSLADKLVDASASGSLSSVLGCLRDDSPFAKDYNGYLEACRELDLLENTIQSYTEDRNGFFRNALISGQKLTVLISYVLYLIVTIALVT